MTFVTFKLQDVVFFFFCFVLTEAAAKVQNPKINGNEENKQTGSGFQRKRLQTAALQQLAKKTQVFCRADRS